jgi:signal transduction histidine kinase
VLRGTAGVIATVPILLAFSPGRREAWLPARKFELGMTAALTALAAVTIFFSPTNLGYWSYARSFLPYPFLVWAALRLGLPGLAICTLIVTSCAVQGTAAGRGPFVADHDLNSVLIVWTYLCISTVTSLLLCVSREERRELEAMLIEAGELERIRLGTELHDDICQQLAGAGFIGSSLRNRPEWIAPEARIQLDHVCTEIQRSIQSMRNLARGLSPLGIGTQHLSVALADLAALSEAIYGIECRFNAAKPLPALNRDATTHLFRITQEAVSNSVRHGHAARVEIIAETSDHGLNLSVADNGHGLPDTLDDKGGLGFKTMAYRADLMNGSFSVRNRSDQCGVVVTCSIPVLSN